jgi:hypothetical protein
VRLRTRLGDVAAPALLCWPLLKAQRFGVTSSLLRMIGNVVIEGMVGAIPPKYYVTTSNGKIFCRTPSVKGTFPPNEKVQH